MWVHLEREQQVARGGASLPGTALAAQADLLPVVHARGDAGGDGAALDGQPHLGAERRLAEGHAGAGGDVLAAHGATAAAGGEAAGCPAALAEHAQDVVEVGVRAARAGGEAAATAGDAARARAAAAEHGGEDVVEAGAGGAALARGEAGAAGAHGADRVVLLALLGVVEHGVCLTDLLEPLLGLRVAGVAVRVQLLGLLPVRLLDRGSVGILRDAEDRVEVLVEPVLSGHVSRLLPGCTL